MSEWFAEVYKDTLEISNSMTYAVIDWFVSAIITIGTNVAEWALEDLDMADDLKSLMATDAFINMCNAVNFAGNFIDYAIVFSAMGIATTIVSGMALVKFIIKLIPTVG